MKHARFYCTAAAIPVLLYAWMVCASEIFLLGMGHQNLFKPPYLQWLDGVRWWGYSPQVRLWTCIGAAVPTAILILLAVAVIRRRIRSEPDPLYGATAWAGTAEMNKGGIGLKRKLF